MKLRNKVAVVTGANRGLGKAIAVTFALEGADVVLAARGLEECRQVAKEIEAIGGKAAAFKCDVSSEADVLQLVAGTVDRFSGVDILVNNAGTSTVGKLVDSTEEDWNLNMDVNGKGTFFCSKHFARRMIDQGRGGKIVNISSRGGRVGLEDLGHYSASKFAVIGLTETLAVELAPYFINVNAICPGRIETEMTRRELIEHAARRSITVDEYRKEYYAPIPWRRPGTSEDIAYAAVFLSSSDSDYITGTTLNVTGGLDVVRGGNT